MDVPLDINLPAIPEDIVGTPHEQNEDDFIDDSLELLEYINNNLSSEQLREHLNNYDELENEINNNNNLALALERSNEESYASKSVNPKDTNIKECRINILTKKLYKITKDNSCTICLEQFKSKQKIGITQCKHLFHNPCIVKWMKHGNNCPICRKIL
jgi:hypothetical protein